MPPGLTVNHSTIVDRDHIASTYEVIRPHIRRTPVVEVDGSDFGLDGIRLMFKLELMQHSGSFKARGAFANLLLRQIPAVGVVAASGGNHGTAVAFAAMKLKKPARIFVPEVASPTKLERIRAYGAELVVTGERYADALAASQVWAAQSGALAVHAYDQVETLLGQGSVGLEFEDQSPRLDSLVVAVGGGGLIGGIAAWYGERIKIIGVEPEAAPTLTSALAAGRPVDTEAGGIAADSLAPKRVGDLMFPIAQAHVASVLLVSDESIQEAQRALWRVLRVVAEPGGAAAFAALLSRRYRPRPGERVGVLVCGGNTTAVDFTL
ncbi:MAG: threonine/serine dehydratase [Terriglobales bacterium]